MLGIHRRIGVDLEGKVVATGVLKEAIHGIEKLIGELEKPFPVVEIKSAKMNHIMIAPSTYLTSVPSNFL